MGDDDGTWTQGTIPGFSVMVRFEADYWPTMALFLQSSPDGTPWIEDAAPPVKEAYYDLMDALDRIYRLSRMTGEQRRELLASVSSDA